MYAIYVVISSALVSFSLGYLLKQSLIQFFYLFKHWLKMYLTQIRDAAYLTDTAYFLQMTWSKYWNPAGFFPAENRRAPLEAQSICVQ